MSAMVERVRKALEETAASQEHGFDGGPEDWTPYVRAALEAMREVPQEMFLAAEKAGISFATQQRVWPPMIDAALDEQP